VGLVLSNIEFLIDENVLGLDRYLDTFNIKYRKVGDPNCPEKESDDPIVAKFAKEENLVILTNDDKLKKQCELLDVKCLFNDLTDFARRVRDYNDAH